MRRIGTAFLALCLAACGSIAVRVLPQPPTATAHALPINVLLAPVDARPDYLSNDILFRRTSDGTLHPYANVHWQEAPVDALRDSLHAGSAGTLTLLDAKPQRAHCALTVEISAYEHVIDGPQHYGEMRLNYALVHLNSHEKLMEGNLDIKIPTQAADADAAAGALSQASNEAVQRILDDLGKALSDPQKRERCSKP